MQDFEGYFTLDGSVGLYSESDNDIYHSAYGALTEAYEKFILPANFDKYFENNNNVEILDICYGIGYNTKSFLNYFLENIFQKKYQKNNIHAETVETIGVDNIYHNLTKLFCKNKNKTKSIYHDKRYSNNISRSNLQQHIQESNLSTIKNKQINKKYSIFIKAIDINTTLMKLSPFIKVENNITAKITKPKKTGIKKVDLLLSKNLDMKNKKLYKLLPEVNIILIMKLIDKFKIEIFSEDVVKILTSKLTSNFFDKKMINFAKFYLKSRYNLSSEGLKSTFLHNIYYQYVSKSYKNVLKILENNEICIEFDNNDARKACNDEIERYNYIFLDAFSPAKAPVLWSEDFMKLLFNHLNYNGMLLTYSKSAAVRHAMMINNFELGKIYNKNDGRFYGTVASKNPNLVKYKLNDYDLGLLKTLAGVTYKDKSLNLTNQELIKNRNKELENSTLQSSSSFIKEFKGDNKNEI